ncbi:MAG: hypothetical protein HZA50_01395 [Planctomycetes bacterium]|nr:hypothetical protein [Planctomycetota bacterium]
MKLNQYNADEVGRSLNKVFQLRGDKLRDIPSNMSVESADCPPVALRYGNEDVLDMLCQGEVKPEHLMMLKHVGKELALKNFTPESRIFGKVLYNAAIASSLVNWGRMISNLEPAFITHNLDILRIQNWLPENLRVLFEKAMDICRPSRPSAA